MDPQNFPASSAGRTLRAPGKEYWAFYPAPLPRALEWTPALVATLSDAAGVLGELKGLGHSLTNPHWLIAPLIPGPGCDSPQSAPIGSARGLSRAVSEPASSRALAAGD
jgi:hypothetical protein